jgi:DNA helicase MCM8
MQNVHYAIRLQATAAIAPRAVFVCGNTATTAGLTVALTREVGSRGSDMTLEAGALVLADQVLSSSLDI